MLHSRDALVPRRCAASHASSGFARGAAPLRRGVFFVRIIYALITVINNSGVENRVGRRGEAPQAKPQNERPARVEGRSSVPGGATPSATTGC